MSDQPDGAPLKKSFCNRFALGVMANGANSAVTHDVDFRLGFRLRLFSRNRRAAGFAGGKQIALRFAGFALAAA